MPSPTLEPSIRIPAWAAAPKRRSRRSRARAIPADTVAQSLLGAAVVAAMLGVGGVHVPPLVAVAILACAGAGVALWLEPRQSPWRGPTVVLLALAAWSVVQALPLPAAVVAALSPRNAAIWSRALAPLHEPPPAWQTLSLDPRASVVEALRALTYATLVVGAAAASARRGVNWAAVVLTLAAAAAGAATMAHGFFGATKLYGVFQGSAALSPWHVGPLLNPNSLAGYLVLGFASGLALMVTKRPPVPRIVLAPILAALAAAVVTTGSRGGAAALAVTVLAAPVVALRPTANESAGRRWLLAGSYAVVVAGAAALVYLAVGRTGETELADANLDKLHMVRWLARMATDAMPAGFGRGAFESVSPAYAVTVGHVTVSHAENVVFQWLIEWGLPGALALVVMFVMLVGAAIAARRDRGAACLAVGVAAVIAQNLVDLGLEIPAQAAAVALACGAIGGASKRWRSPGVEPPPGTSTRATWILGVATAVLSVASLVVGMEGDAGAKERVERAYAALDPADPESRANLRAVLRADMLRRPAEPYFTVVGAALAHATDGDDPTPWIEHALERQLTAGRVHMLDADVLAERDDLAHARLELRLALQDDPSIVDQVAARAASYGRDLAEWREIAPPTPAGERLLVRISQQLVDPERAREVLEHVLERNPRHAEAHLVLARLRIANLERDLAYGPCSGDARDACLDDVETHARALDELTPHRADAAICRARALGAVGEAERADALLARRCGPQSKVENRFDCLSARLTVALRAKWPERSRELARQLVNSGCETRDGCVVALTTAARSLTSVGENAAALRYLTRLAREYPSDTNWDWLASSASSAGAHALAIEALEQLGRLRTGDQPDLKKRIDDERRAAMGTILEEANGARR